MNPAHWSVFLLSVRACDATWTFTSVHMWLAGSNRLASFSQNVVRQSRDAKGHLECICETSVGLMRWVGFLKNTTILVSVLVVLIHSYSVSSVLHEEMVALVL